MAYSASKIEFLRFGSRFGGEGIGCCAVDVIQGFVNDPEAPATVQLFNGDRDSKDGSPEKVYHNGKMEFAYLGKTNREVFENYIRIGTFAKEEMPDHGFLAVLTEEQLKTAYGKQWLRIMKENGFEFLRTINNSVYTGSTVNTAPPTGKPHKNYVFALFRNISNCAVEDPFTPPAEWSKIPEMTKTVKEHWLENKTRIYAESELFTKAEEAKASPFAHKAEFV